MPLLINSPEKMTFCGMSVPVSTPIWVLTSCTHKVFNLLSTEVRGGSQQEVRRELL